MANHYIYLQLENELRAIILNSKTTNKTLYNKLRAVLRENKHLFKNKSEEAVYSEELKLLKIKRRCYECLKSGFLKKDGYSSMFKLSDITSINSYVGDRYEVTLSNGKKEEIKEFDFLVLQEIFS